MLLVGIHHKEPHEIVPSYFKNPINNIFDKSNSSWGFLKFFVYNKATTLADKKKTFSSPIPSKTESRGSSETKLRRGFNSRWCKSSILWNNHVFLSTETSDNLRNVRHRWKEVANLVVCNLIRVIYGLNFVLKAVYTWTTTHFLNA